MAELFWRVHLEKTPPKYVNKKFEEDLGTIVGKKDSHKVKELKFYKDFNKEGITNESVILSALKFKKVYDGFEANLTKQPIF